MPANDAAARGAPLAGLRVLITRARLQSAGLADALRQLGAEPIECPAIEIVPPDDYGALDEALLHLDRYDWVIFTSANGVAAVLRRLRDLGRDGSALSLVRIGAIGPATAAALMPYGLAPALVPDTYVAEALLEALGDVGGQRMLLARAELAREMLADGLRLRGAVVDEVTAYRTVPGQGLAAVAPRLAAGGIDAILFTSSSTVRYFLAGLEQAGISPDQQFRSAVRPAILCIGPVTAETARARGVPVDAVAEEFTTAGLLAALRRLFEPGAARPQASSPEGSPHE